MDVVKKYDFKVRTICSTAYKALLLLKYLIVMPLTKEQINSLFSDDKVISQDCSSDTLRIIINSLKEVGCSFSRPVASKNLGYELIKNPFSLNFTQKEIELLNKFRKNLCVQNNWQQVLSLDMLIDKICLAINDEETKTKLKNHSNLSNINPNLIFEIQKYCENKNTVIFEYLSGRKSTEFEMVASCLKFERGRLYVWGFSSKHDDYSYIRVDKIKSAKVIKFSKDNIVPKKLVIEYKMYDTGYTLDENEVLKEKTEEYLLIEYTAENKFYAIQKFLEMGFDCEVISPDSFRQEIINVLKSIVERYKDDEE